MDFRSPQGDGRLSDPETLPLLGAALWRSGVPSGDVALGTGTPLGSFSLERAKAKEFLEGRELEVVSSLGEHRRYRIVKLVLRPQSVAATIHAINRGVLRRGNGMAAVLDFGSRTCDVVTIDLGTMDPITQLCFSVQAGVNDVASGMSALIEQATGFAPSSPRVALEAIASPVNIRGKTIGGFEAAEPVLRSVADRLRDALAVRYGDAGNMISVLVPVGGGAIVLGSVIETVLPAAEIARLGPHDLPYANALGYFQEAERAVWR